MSEFIISSCSTMDLNMDRARQRNILVLNFNYYLDGVEYSDDMFEKSDAKEFYNAMVDGADTRTAQVNVGTYAKFFRNVLSQGKDLLHIAFSSGISGSYNSARIAAEEVRAEFPDRKLLLVDSLAASSGFGLFVEKIADLRDQGKTIEEAFAWANENKRRVHHWFTSMDLTFYVKGGRVSKVAGWFGTVLKICPVLNVDHQGKLIPREKVRGKSNALKRLVDKMEENAENGLKYDDRCYICNSDSYEDALTVKNMVEERFANLKDKVEIYNIGPTIGSHSGPGTVALFFMGKERID
ncbi:MAG: DegV family protein [Clostridia bacterium]|nr:DegV family protein [Clostridia bacterium]